MPLCYVPAGVVPYVLNYDVCTKHGKFSDTIEYEFNEEKRRAIIRTPDREIWIAKNQVRADCDEHFTTDPYSKGSITDPYLKYALFSAHTGHAYGDRKQSTWKTNENIKTIVDSGGAQLVFGTESFVDPSDVIKVYNACADVAIALDIPPRPADRGNLEYFKVLARGQQKTTEIFKKKVDKSRKIDWLNTLHGFVPGEHRLWLDMVDDSFFTGWAAGFKSDNYYCNLMGILIPLLEGKKGKKEHFHILGQAGKNLFPLFAWMGKVIPTLTCDSSNHIHTAVRAKMFENFMPSGAIEMYRMGDRPLNNVEGSYDSIDFSPAAEIPCCCPLCSTLKYSKIYTFPSCTGVSYLLSIHNLINNMKYCIWWNDQAAKSTTGEYVNTIKKYCSKQQAEFLTELIYFFDYAVEHGLGKTEHKFRQELKQANTMKVNDMPTLFDVADKKRLAHKQNYKFLNSAVLENLPNYLSFDELKHVISEDAYKDAKLKTLHRKKQKLKFSEIETKYRNKISLNGMELLRG